ncbi:MAG TPA: helix-turn-helix transcriptional regulator [Niabella sp.]|jgi:transcriptional regulator with XRE-family HTH domain|nr:helix-turn-helix transcriptional regulator [Niabella sp.]
MKKIKDRHIGRNIRAIRQLRGMKQETFARQMGIAQQNVSKMEKKKEITDEQLEQVAKVLKTTTDAIKEFDENAIINNNILNEQVNNYNINPLEKVAELFKELLLTRDHEIQRLKEELDEYKTGVRKPVKTKASKLAAAKPLHSIDGNGKKVAVQ